MVSAMKCPGMHLVPNLIDMNLPGIAPVDAEHMSQAEYIARVLAEVLRAALRNIVPLGGRAVDYSDLPEAVFTDIAPHFNLTLTAAQIETMKAKTPFHAKNPQMFFEPDTESKQLEAAADARALCAEHLDPLYTQLRAL